MLASSYVLLESISHQKVFSLYHSFIADQYIDSTDEYVYVYTLKPQHKIFFWGRGEYFKLLSKGN